MRLFLLSICFLIFINCQESEIRRPVNKNKKLFLKESAIRNKNRFEIEQELFKKFAENSMLEFSISEFGFWYAHKTGRKINGKYKYLNDLEIEDYKGLFSIIPEENFRLDISSTEIRDKL